MELSALDAMKLAIEEAKKGIGFVSPNPLVGCVILNSNNELIGKGYHARVGEGHAEINALASVQDPKALQGAHVFVTLEPCAFTGRTGPCADKLASLPIAAVTYGLEDPHPKVSGRGAEVLRAAGKHVTRYSGLQDELEDVAEIFLTNTRAKRPFVAVKVGSSLDGHIALSTGESQWITNEQSRAEVQLLRGMYDAVLIGANTFLKDDPRLDSRDPRFKGRPQRVVLIDTKGRCLPALRDSNLLKVRRREDVFLVVGRDVKISDELAGVTRVEVGHSDWETILTKLFEAGVMSLLVEGGASTIGTLFSEKKVDRLYTFIAPKVLGAQGSLPWSRDFGIAKLSEARHLSRVRTQIFGDDVMITGRFL